MADFPLVTSLDLDNNATDNPLGVLVVDPITDTARHPAGTFAVVAHDGHETTVVGFLYPAALNALRTALAAPLAPAACTEFAVARTRTRAEEIGVLTAAFNRSRS